LSVCFKALSQLSGNHIGTTSISREGCYGNWGMRFAFAFALAIVSVACSSETERAQQFYASATPPKTPVDFLVLAKRISESDLYRRDDFYTDARLRQLFGEQLKIEIIHLSGSGVDSNKSLRATIIGFQDVGFTSAVDHMLGTAGIVMEVQRVVRQLNPYCDVRIDASSDMQELSFKSVVGALGSDWVEDKNGETEDFISVTREIFNPPYPNSTGYMGNAFITYKTPKGEITLHFRPDGNLSKATFPSPKCD